MKNYFLILSVFAFISSCNQEPLITVGDRNNRELEVRGKEKDIQMCSYDSKKGVFKVVTVKEKQVPKQQTKGYYILDADGDGYSATGACTGTKDDCDDNNPSIHPGGTEICGNQIDDDCDGLYDCADPDCAETCSTCPCFELENLTACSPYFYVCDIGPILFIECNGFRLNVSDSGSNHYSVSLVDSVNLIFCNQQINSNQYASCMSIARQAISISGHTNDCANELKTTKLPARPDRISIISPKSTKPGSL